MAPNFSFINQMSPQLRDDPGHISPPDAIDGRRSSILVIELGGGEPRAFHANLRFGQGVGFDGYAGFG